MQIIYVDDEPHALTLFRCILEEWPHSVTVHTFGTATEALAHGAAHSVDVAFLDMNMEPMGGLALAEELGRIQPQARLAFITGNIFAMDSKTKSPIPYIFKPYGLEDLLPVLEAGQKIAHGDCQ